MVGTTQSRLPFSSSSSSSSSSSPLKEMGSALASLLLVMLLILLSIHGHLATSVVVVTSSQKSALLRLPCMLGNPSALRKWNDYTNFCELPSSPSLSLTCDRNGSLTSLEIVGNNSENYRLNNSRNNNANNSGNGTTTSSSANLSDSLFALLSAFPHLQTLTLTSLGLSGELSAKCSRLRAIQRLNLSGNYFSGPIPPQLAFLVNLKTLVLSDNQFSGALPPSLFAIPFLEILLLDQNNLSGQLPANLVVSPSLKFVDLSTNLLTGELPPALISAWNQFGLLLNLQNNCFTSQLSFSTTQFSPQSESQYRINYCHNPAIAIAMAGVQSKKPPVVTSGSSHTIRLAILAGIVVSSAILAIIFILCIVVMIKRRFNKHGSMRRKSSIRSIYSDGNTTPTLSTRVLANARYITQTMQLGAILGSSEHKIFTMRELNEATNFFDSSTLLRENKNGKVYRGCLEDGSIVAIKCIKVGSDINSANVDVQIDHLCKVRHRHLVNFLGRYVQTKDGDKTIDKLFLIFEFMPGGTLRAKLSGVEGLSWTKRLEAVIGAAKGLHFLHTGVVPGIFGNDFGIQNILLDQDFLAKLSGYEGVLLADECKHANLSGYEGAVLADEYKNVRLMHQLDADRTEANHSKRKKFSDRNDVFNFGLILLEIVLGRPALLHGCPGGAELKDLDLLVTDGGGIRMEAIDSRIIGTCVGDSVNTVVEIATKCLSNNIISRPSMEDVLWNLQYALQVQDTSNAESMDGTCNDSVATNSSRRSQEDNRKS